MRYFSIVFLAHTFFLSTPSFGQIPASRLADWSRVGLRQNFDNSQTIIDVTSMGAQSNGTFDNAAVVNNIINSASPQTTLYFPEGTYHFDSPIALKSDISLTGDGSDKTQLVFGALGEHDCIEMHGTQNIDTVLISSNIKKGDTGLAFSSNVAWSPGTVIRVSESDQDRMTSSWAWYRSGQVVQVKSVNTNSITLDHPMRRAYDVADTALVVSFSPIKNVSIDGVHLEREEGSLPNRSNISMKYALNCQVSCISSDKCDFSHVTLENSLHCEVRGSYFKDGLDYGGGGSAYGVTLMHTTSECLVQDNVFEHLRHSMLLQSGANGNVVAYNYSTDPYWVSGSLPSNSAGDLVLHGNYPYANLFEGNVVQNIVIDESHGINGPHNVFLRNRAELYGFFMNAGTPTDSVVIVGNEIPNRSVFRGLYVISGSGHFEKGNDVRGAVLPTGSTAINEDGLYLSAPIEHYTENNSWPPIGLPNTEGENEIEVETLYKQGRPNKCREGILVGTEIIPNLEVSIYPNPATKSLHIQNVSQKHIMNMTIQDASGRVVLEDSFSDSVDISNISPGIYFLSLHSNETQSTIKFVKL